MLFSSAVLPKRLLVKKLELSKLEFANPMLYRYQRLVLWGRTLFPSLDSMIFSRPVKAPQNMNRMFEVSIVYTSPLSELPPDEGGVLVVNPKPVRTRPGRCLSDI